jgi:hypothetical protein
MYVCKGNPAEGARGNQKSTLRRSIVQVARTVVIRDQLRATKILVCGENTQGFCHSCREQQISNETCLIFSVIHDKNAYLVCGEQFIVTFQFAALRSAHS